MKSVILIVDDERLLAETIGINLGKAGFETIAAYDGDSALAMVRDHKPDLVILDVMLPKNFRLGSVPRAAQRRRVSHRRAGSDADCARRGIG
jgi:DNA-binding response OmpR family regulator